MKNIQTIIFCFIIIFVLSFAYGLPSINFSENEQALRLENNNNFIYLCNFKRNSGYNYLYIYPQNFREGAHFNKAIFKIYFKEIENADSFQDSSLNYLNSNYSSIDFNAGLFIELAKLKYDTGILYVFSYQTCNFKLLYKYTKTISFPSYSEYSNFLLNQFILQKGATTPSIKYTLDNGSNNYLLILSKTSLRNIEVKVIYNTKDATEEKLAYLYPNGCSVFLDYDKMTVMDITLTINNKNNHDDIILLGTIHNIEEELFPNEVVNGFQLYIEGNNNDLNNLLIKGESSMIQYFSTQIYNKDVYIFFDSTSYPLIEYNSMFPYTVHSTKNIGFSFGSAPERSALYFQYIDYSDKEIAQKSLQSLVTGVPKAMKIPSGNYMYHFLPKERKSNNLYFYLKPKTQEKIFVSFKSCSSYPEGCSFNENGNLGAEIIQNVGLWHSLPRNSQELQLILTYCEKECSYDVLMQYEESDPLFLFPDSDYSKFISTKENDMFALPVFEYFETSGNKWKKINKY